MAFYVEPPDIPEGMTVAQYRAARPRRMSRREKFRTWVDSVNPRVYRVSHERTTLRRSHHEAA